ncbi:hypothetical protein BH11VER1_BH11VER1_11070 [soil metagenome]
MLYQLWRQTLITHRDYLAVHDVVAGLRHRFSDLQKALDQLPTLKSRSLHEASIQQGAWHFILQTLRAWRDDAVLCPVDHASPGIVDAGILPAQVCHLKLTSGSTGEPRCIMFEAAQLRADVENIRASMQLDAAIPNLAVISLAHSYGFSNLVLPLLLQGQPLVLVPDALPGSLRLAFGHHDHLILPAVPAMWRAWYRSELLHASPISLAISAGAPLPLELEQTVYDECGLKIHNFYGSSECGGIAYDNTNTPRTDAAFAGRTMQGVSLSCTEAGNLQVQSDAVGLGYLSPDQTGVDTLSKGRFIASDLAEISDGRVFLRGRISDAINVAGKKLNPSDVEAAVLTFPEVKHCIVFGVPSADPTRCEETIACVHVADGITEDHLATWLCDRLALWQMPRRYWLCQDLLPDVRGKISRREWKEKWLKVQD